MQAACPLYVMAGAKHKRLANCFIENQQALSLPCHLCKWRVVLSAGTADSTPALHPLPHQAIFQEDAT